MITINIFSEKEVMDIKRHLENLDKFYHKEARNVFMIPHELFDDLTPNQKTKLRICMKERHREGIIIEDYINRIKDWAKQKEE